MTAFSRYEAQGDLGSLSWEVRSVNHRYLEMSFRLEESFRPLEMTMRKLVTERLSRGKVELALRYKAPEQTEQSVELNTDIAQGVIDSYETLAKLSSTPAPLDLMKVMQWPGVIQSEGLDQDALRAWIVESLSTALDDLTEMREREGASLEQMILQRCEQIDDIAKDVRTRMPEIIKAHHQKLTDRVAEMSASVDPERLEQELVLMAQKSDVAEEVDRLQSHVKEVQHVLSRNEPIGRRLDFLMQELNREANTLGSKSIDTDTTRYSVELKVLIEQMREQIQNIE
jgi:uncharacterized protein (TIGR00255 family)